MVESARIEMLVPSLMWVVEAAAFWIIVFISVIITIYIMSLIMQSKKISNDQELIQSDPTSCPQNQKGNN